MRAIVLGLILVNILYWTWSGNVDTTPVKLVRALDPDLPKLELVPRPLQPQIDDGDTEPQRVSRVGSDDVISVDMQNEADAEGAAQQLQPAVARGTAQGDPGAPSAEAAVQNPADVDPAIAERPAPVPVSPLVAQNLLATVDPVTNPARCVGVGPFASLRQASDAAARLNQAGLTTSQRVEEAQVWVGHWVHLPSYPTREAAILVVERLRKEGVQDIYIEPSGELKNTISLGLFTELEGAEIRAGKVRKLGGVSPQIRNRSRDGLVYWIDLALDSGVRLDTTGLPHNAAEELRVEPVDCPPVAADG